MKRRVVYRRRQSDKDSAKKRHRVNKSLLLAILAVVAVFAVGFGLGNAPLESAASRADEAESSLAALAEGYTDLEGRYEALAEDYSDLEKRYEALEREHANCREKIAGLEEQVNDLQELLDKISAEQTKEAEPDGNTLVIAPTQAPEETLGKTPSSGSSGSAIVSPPVDSDTMVWKSETGSKYHNRNNCGRMNPDKATRISLSTARSLGLTACKNCY